MACEDVRQPQELRGQLVSVRKLSKKLAFLDLKFDALPDDCANDAAAECPGAELVLRAQDGLISEERVQELRHTLKLGDVVSVRAVREADTHMYHVADAAVLHAWRNTHPGACFVPAPLFLRKCVQRNPPRTAAEHAAPAENSSCAAARADGSATPTAAVQPAAEQPGASAAQQGAQQQQQQQQLCKYWLNTGRCTWGDACTMLHSNDMRAKQQWIGARRQRRRELSSAAGNPHASTSAAKCLRAAVFADWLEATYGRELLCSGSGVLDVAGGRGAISFELHTKRGIPCTTVDPRPMKLSREQHRFLESRLDLGQRLPPHVGALFGPELWAHSEHAAQLQDCSVVVGMHPDEATDAIVDFADAYGKPFAVVPCCVFARRFKHRVVLDNSGQPSPVQSHAQLVQYLLQRRAAQLDYLTFEGINQVVYRRGGSGAQ